MDYGIYCYDILFIYRNFGWFYDLWLMMKMRREFPHQSKWWTWTNVEDENTWETYTPFYILKDHAVFILIRNAMFDMLIYPVRQCSCPLLDYIQEYINIHYSFDQTLICELDLYVQWDQIGINPSMSFQFIISWTLTQNIT